MGALQALKARRLAVEVRAEHAKKAAGSAIAHVVYKFTSNNRAPGVDSHPHFPPGMVGVCLKLPAQKKLIQTACVVYNKQ